jgi:hypothetical protein
MASISVKYVFGIFKKEFKIVTPPHSNFFVLLVSKLEVSSG